MEEIIAVCIARHNLNPTLNPKPHGGHHRYVHHQAQILESQVSCDFIFENRHTGAFFSFFSKTTVTDLKKSLSASIGCVAQGK